MIQPDICPGKSCPKNILIQTGKNSSAYKTRYSFCRHQYHQSILYYNGLNTHSGHKKRLVQDGKVITRVTT